MVNCCNCLLVSYIDATDFPLTFPHDENMGQWIFTSKATILLKDVRKNKIIRTSWKLITKPLSVPYHFKSNQSFMYSPIMNIILKNLLVIIPLLWVYVYIFPLHWYVKNRIVWKTVSVWRLSNHLWVAGLTIVVMKSFTFLFHHNSIKVNFPQEATTQIMYNEPCSESMAHYY